MATIENKIPGINNLVKKNDENYDEKISEIESKYIDTDDNNNFTKDTVTNKIKSER